MLPGKIGYSKALLPYGLGNKAVRSGDESVVSNEGNCEKLTQARPEMVKIMNLNYSRTVLPWTAAQHLLKGSADYANVSESDVTLGKVDLSLIQQMKRLQGPKTGKRVVSRTWGSPKERKLYGDGAAILGRDVHTEGRQDRQGSSTTPITPLGSGKLKELHELNKLNPNLINEKLIHVISDIDVLRLSYELIKSKPGNMTLGITEETLNGLDLEFLLKMSKTIKSGKYKFSASRRVWIPKSGKTEERPLGIASPREKIVQKSLEMVLTAIYEPLFKDTSHGFRPNKGTHSALKMVDVTFKGANWFIEADISKCFDEINHEVLMNILKKKIKCDKTLALLKSALRAGYIEVGGLSEKGILGTPQGSVLSPLLCNIYLHELDCYVEKLRIDTDKGTRRRQNPKYTKILNRMANSSKEERILLRKELRKNPAKDPMDLNFIRLRYVRYADDFLLSIIGPRNLANDVKNKIKTFLSEKLKLRLNGMKTQISEARKTPARFLGVEIKWRKTQEKKVVLTKNKKKARITSRIEMRAPMKDLVRKLVARKFAKWDLAGKTVIPSGLTFIQNQSHADIVSYYNAVIRGILNYYSMADNRSQMGSLVRILRMSCARTLALKYKMRFMSKAFKKFGRKLKCPETNKELYIPKDLKRTRTFNVSEPENLEMLERRWTGKLTRSSLGKECIICGKTPAEMHHIRKLKELKSRKTISWFTMQMAAINRKQVPLCRDHHIRLHNNQLTDEERNLFAQGRRK